VLQDSIAIIFGELAQLNAFSKVPLDPADPAGQRLPIDVAQQDSVARGGSHLSNSVAHSACAYDADGLNILRIAECVQSFA
jgi:hypothetical protein